MWIRVTALHSSRHPAVSTTAKADARLGLVLAGRYHAAMPRCLPIAVALIVTLAPAATVGADLIAGTIDARVVKVIDGDTLEIADERIRLHGIDAPGDCVTVPTANDPT